MENNKKKPPSPLTKELRDYINNRISAELLNISNANIEEVKCYHKNRINFDTKIDPLTEVMIYHDKVLKVFCIFNTKGNDCSYQYNETKKCYLHLQKSQ
jgi:hypothetical protein